MDTRDDLLKLFLANKEFVKFSTLNAEEIGNVTFGTESDDILAEALKTFLILYDKKSSKLITLRDTNVRIDSLSI